MAATSGKGHQKKQVDSSLSKGQALVGWADVWRFCTWGQGDPGGCMSDVALVRGQRF